MEMTFFISSFYSTESGISITAIISISRRDDTLPIDLSSPCRYRFVSPINSSPVEDSTFNQCPSPAHTHLNLTGSLANGSTERRPISIDFIRHVWIEDDRLELLLRECIE
ncbi:hypothetical protein ACP275_13G051000 [Erythranthe tilingii]